MRIYLFCLMLASLPASAESHRHVDATDPAYSVLEIRNLPTTLRANNGRVSVDIKLHPALRPEHRLRLLLDGRPYTRPSERTHLSLMDVDRGRHSLEVQVLEGEQVVQQSEPEVFHLQRARRR